MPKRLPIATRVRELDAAEPGLTAREAADRLGVNPKHVYAARARSARLGAPPKPGAGRRVALPESLDKDLLKLARRLGKRPEDVLIDLVRGGLEAEKA